MMTKGEQLAAEIATCRMKIHDLERRCQKASAAEFYNYAEEIEKLRIKRVAAQVSLQALRPATSSVAAAHQEARARV